MILRTVETLSSAEKMESFDILRYISHCERRDATRALPKAWFVQLDHDNCLALSFWRVSTAFSTDIPDGYM